MGRSTSADSRSGFLNIHLFLNEHPTKACEIPASISTTWFLNSSSNFIFSNVGILYTYISANFEKKF